MWDEFAALRVRRDDRFRDDVKGVRAHHFHSPVGDAYTESQEPLRGDSFALLAIPDVTLDIAPFLSTDALGANAREIVSAVVLLTLPRKGSPADDE